MIISFSSSKNFKGHKQRKKRINLNILTLQFIFFRRKRSNVLKYFHSLVSSTSDKCVRGLNLIESKLPFSNFSTSEFPVTSIIKLHSTRRSY